MAGLLDFLRPAQSAQVGDYSMPRMGSAAAYGDGSSPDGFMGRLSSGLQGIGNGGSVLGAIGSAFGFGGQPAQASPIQMGDYSMPRVGDASAYQSGLPVQPSGAKPTPGDFSGGGGSSTAGWIPDLGLVPQMGDLGNVSPKAPSVQFVKPSRVDLSGLQNAMASRARAPSRG